eukprot:1190330-Prorocentrum_minimum.AAC.1
MTAAAGDVHSPGASPPRTGGAGGSTRGPAARPVRGPFGLRLGQPDRQQHRVAGKRHLCSGFRQRRRGRQTLDDCAANCAADCDVLGAGRKRVERDRRGGGVGGTAVFAPRGPRLRGAVRSSGAGNRGQSPVSTGNRGQSLGVRNRGQSSVSTRNRGQSLG